MRFSETEIYAIDLEGTRAVARVWRTPHIDSTTGARLAAQLGADITRLVGERTIDTFVFDITDAPSVAGPKTSEMLGKLFATCERARVTVEVLVTDDPMKHLQFKRLIAENAPKHGRIRVKS
jgi:hypothetical protein